MAQTNDARTILARRIGADAAMRQMIAAETLKAQIARMLHRIAAALGHALDMRLVPVPAHRQSA